MPRLGGCCHQLLGIYYATHLAPRLGGWIRHGSQGISMPWFFGSFIRNLEDLDSKLGVCRDRRLDNYSGHEHLTALMQPRKHSEDTFNKEFGRTRRHLQKYSKACSTRLWRARGLVRPKPTGLRTWPTYYKIRGGTWPTPYTGCNYL
jgi:hypothetical protein